jgi:hypothetical protein
LASGLNLGRRRDPFFLDTRLGHRNGLWVKRQFDPPDVELASPIGGVHYVPVAAGDVIKPDGTPYLNTRRDYLWLVELAANAVRWLGYIDAAWIVDKRNDAPVIFRSPDWGDGTLVRAYASLGLPSESLCLDPHDVAVVDCLP